MPRHEEGRFCSHTDENGEICGKLMVEKLVFWHCPVCGSAEKIPPEMIEAKIRKGFLPRRVNLSRQNVLCQEGVSVIS